eukprot:GHRQ01017049.1.p1 GENE.GHRQ01017049.1~~GHRQ01017049.1.p1  ORF type:complete len:462 (+),score=221.66 GHRQ01017049.1:319-1704(+)
MARDKKTAQRKSAATSTSAAASGKAEPKKSKKANQGSYDSLREPLDRELALLGLRVKQITADGNCFFRALSDQLEGNEHQHSALRARVVGLMQAHEDDYAPFVEDDQSWQAYTSRMKKEGTWAGHIELQAASLLLQANIAVYQAGQPRWSITNFPAGSRWLHLSYHDGEHYNSVRRADDCSPGPPQPITDLVPAANAGELQSSWSLADEARVAAGTACDNPALIKQQLAAAGGDVDAAIEAIIEILGAEDEPASTEVVAAAPPAAPAVEVQAAGGTGVVVEDELGEAAAAGDSQHVAGSPGGAAAVAHMPSALAEGQHISDSHAEEPPAAAAATAEDVTGSSKAGQVADIPAAAATSAISSQTALQTSAQHAAAAGSGGHGKAAKPIAGIKLKHAKGGAAVGGAADGGSDKRPSRNKCCPCGSGRKHKNCCGLKSTGSGKTTSQERQTVDGLPAQLLTLHI